jgi:hypothetical protein
MNQSNSVYNANFCIDDVYIPSRALEGQWFTIESVPQDKTPVLLYFPNFKQPIEIGYCSKREWDDKAEPEFFGGWPFQLDQYMAEKPKPTHWMPLPTAP